MIIRDRPSRNVHVLSQVVGMIYLVSLQVILVDQHLRHQGFVPGPTHMLHKIDVAMLVSQAFITGELLPAKTPPLNLISALPPLVPLEIREWLNTFFM